MSLPWAIAALCCLVIVSWGCFQIGHMLAGPPDDLDDPDRFDDVTFDDDSAEFGQTVMLDRFDSGSVGEGEISPDPDQVLVPLPGALAADWREQMARELAPEELDLDWHEPGRERAADTDTMQSLMDDPNLVVWDAKRQVELIQKARREYRDQIKALYGEAA